MRGDSPRFLDRRLRRDSFLRALVTTVSFVPLLVLAFMLLTLIDRSMGMRAEFDRLPVRQWALSRTILDCDAIGREALALDPDARLSFHFGLMPRFVFSRPSPRPETTGLIAVLAGSAWILVLGLVLSFPIGLLTALWIDSSSATSRIARGACAVLDQFVRIPHVLYGLFGLALFGWLSRFVPDFGVRNVGSASLLMAFVALPKLSVMMVREIGKIPEDLRTASYALGARWSTVVFRQVLPTSFEGILAETLRIAAELAGLASPFIVLGASQYVSSPPANLGDRFLTLPVQVFQWSLRPDGIYRNLAASSALVLLLCILIMNIISYAWSRRIARRREGLR